jgi:AbrB family looped-hinge helix DNA binding protein
MAITSKNKSTNKKFAKITSKGQITLPIRWRELVATDQVMIEMKGEKIEITPAKFAGKNDDITVFDAIRDNKGKGLKATDLLKILKEIDD